MNIRYLVCLGLLATAPAASGDTAAPHGGRSELWLNVMSWPALDDVRPAAGGRFDSAGFGLGGALYVTLKQFEKSELLWGIEGFIGATDSNVEGVFDTILTRQLYLGGALKWQPDSFRNVYLDTGLGYHLVDMAEVGDYLSGIERKVWDSSRASAYVGSTWDFVGRDGRSGGRWMLGIRAYFADFGVVNGPGPIGPDAGRLDGPLYSVQIGYGVR